MSPSLRCFQLLDQGKLKAAQKAGGIKDAVQLLRSAQTASLLAEHFRRTEGDCYLTVSLPGSVNYPWRGLQALGDV